MNPASTAAPFRVPLGEDRHNVAPPPLPSSQSRPLVATSIARLASQGLLTAEALQQALGSLLASIGFAQRPEAERSLVAPVLRRRFAEDVVTQALVPPAEEQPVEH